MSTIETKEAARIGYNGFLFPHEYSGEGRGLHLSTHAEKETRYIHFRAPDTEWSFQDGGLSIVKKVGVKILTIIVLYSLS
jgi:hypothetical protein